MRRLALLVLAVLPTLWGTCVTWFAAAPETAPAEAVAHCPCCVQTDPVAPTAPGKPPCDGCGFREASRGVLPAQAVPPLPAATVAFDLVPDVDVGHPSAATLHVARAAEAHGPPPDLLSSVVLLI